MSTSHASARWRRKKLDENAAEFRAKEALRLRNYRSRAKEKGKGSLRKRLEEGSRVQDDNELSDDVDAWLYNAVECYSRASYSGRSSPLSSTHSTPPPQSPSLSIKNPRKDDRPLLTHSESHMTTVTFKDAQESLANGQKTLQEWNRRWGTGVTFVHRAANASLGIGLAKLPEDRTHEEILYMVRQGRQALLQLESIAYIDLRSTQVDDFPGFWIEIMRVIQGLNEQVAQADAALQLRSEVQTILSCT